MSKGPLIILSGPSGSGKTTVASRLIETASRPLRRTISATTRPPRPGEVHGQDYYFLTADEFEQKHRDGAFLEEAEVHGHRYGTLQSEVEPYRERGIGVVLVIDVQGAAKVRALAPDHVSIFLKTPSRDELERRLRQRGNDPEPVIQARLANARQELAQAGEYSHQVVNDDLDRTVRELRSIIESQFRRQENAG